MFGSALAGLVIVQGLKGATNYTQSGSPEAWGLGKDFGLLVVVRYDSDDPRSVLFLLHELIHARDILAGNENCGDFYHMYHYQAENQAAWELGLWGTGVGHQGTKLGPNADRFTDY